MSALHDLKERGWDHILVLSSALGFSPALLITGGKRGGEDQSDNAQCCDWPDTVTAPDCSEGGDVEALKLFSQHILVISEAATLNSEQVSASFVQRLTMKHVQKEELLKLNQHQASRSGVGPLQPS